MVGGGVVYLNRVLLVTKLGRVLRHAGDFKELEQRRGGRVGLLLKQLTEGLKQGAWDLLGAEVLWWWKWWGERYVVKV